MNNLALEQVGQRGEVNVWVRTYIDPLIGQKLGWPIWSKKLAGQPSDAPGGFYHG